MRINAETVAALRETWELLFPESPPPEDRQWAIWLLMHGEEAVRKALIQLVTKHRNVGGQMTTEHMWRFTSSVLNRMTQGGGRAVSVSERKS